MSHTLHLTIEGLLEVEASYKSRSKEVMGVGAVEILHCIAWQLPPRRLLLIPQPLQDQSPQMEVGRPTPLCWRYHCAREADATAGGEANFSEDEKSYSTGRGDSLEFKGLIFPSFISTFHVFPSQLTRSHSLPADALTNSRNTARLGIQFAF